MKKIEIAKQIVAENPGLRRRDYVKMFTERAGLTPYGASLYHYNLVTKPRKAVFTVTREQLEAMETKVLFGRLNEARVRNGKTPLNSWKKARTTLVDAIVNEA